MALTIQQMRQSLALAVRGSLSDLGKLLKAILDGDMQAPVVLDSATVTIVADTHYGRPLVFDRAAGVVATLPAATGTGKSYEFFIKTTVTSNALTVKVANTTDVINGAAIIHQDGGDTMVGFEAAATDDTISMNGTTTGGLKGGRIRVTDVASGLWIAQVGSAATGIEATPFSATV